jgi:hypothetical protein
MKAVWVGTSIIAVIYFTIGCSSQNAYDSLRYQQDLDCQKMQGADRDDCMRKSDMSYDEYQRQLKNQPQQK